MFNHDDPEFRKAFGAYLKHLRESVDPPFSREALASKVGVSAKSIQRIEQGQAVSAKNQQLFLKLLVEVGGDRSIVEFAKHYDKLRNTDLGEFDESIDRLEDRNSPGPVTDAPTVLAQPKKSDPSHQSEDSSPTGGQRRHQKNIKSRFSFRGVIKSLSLSPIFAIFFALIAVGTVVIVAKSKLLDEREYWIVFFVLHSLIFSALSIGFFVNSLLNIFKSIRSGPFQIAGIIICLLMYSIFPIFIIWAFIS